MVIAQRPSPKDKRRRRRRRLVTLAVYVVIVFGLAWFAEQRATTTILFVRHADTDAVAPGGDPPLNSIGIARANLLADFLDRIDVVAGVDAIYASEFRRTQQTAEPLAKRLELEIQVADHYDVVGFMEDVLRDHKGEIVLVVTHEDVLAPLVEELHGSKNIAEFGPNDYDRLYIVTIPRWFGRVKTLQLPYALGWQQHALGSG
jgi:broad specificity phosphatase PhoE